MQENPSICMPRVMLVKTTMVQPLMIFMVYRLAKLAYPVLGVTRDIYPQTANPLIQTWT